MASSTTCMICLELFPVNSGVACGSNHFLCKSDLNKYLTENVFPQLYKLKFNNCTVFCPSSGCSSSFCPIELYKLMEEREKSRYISIVKTIADSSNFISRLKCEFQEVLMLRCPACKNPVDPLPDACSAIMCLNCGKYYCNYCFAVFSSGTTEQNRAAAHEHAATHNTSDQLENRDAFLPTDFVIEGQRILQKTQLIDSIRNEYSIVDDSVKDKQQQIALSLILCASDIEDLKIDIMEVWSNTLHVEGSGNIMDVQESGSNQGAPGRQANTLTPATLLAGGTQMANALKTNNAIAALQILNSFQEKFDVNFIDVEYQHPLTSLAILMKQRLIASELLRKGADPRKISSNGRSVFFIAIEAGMLDIVQVILECYPHTDLDAPVTSEPNAYFPLHVAARFNHGHIARFLLQRGASIDAEEQEFGYSPLTLSIIMGNNWAAQELLAAGASVHVTSRNSRTPLFISAEKGQLSILDAMLNRMDVDINAPIVDTGSRLLHVAALHKQPLVVCHLIQKGAHLNIADDEHGYTALNMAIIASCTTAALELIHAGADTLKATKSGRQPLYVAIEKGLLEIARVLIEKGGVDPNKTTTAEPIDGLPLHIAVLYKQPHLVDELIRLGADVDLIDPASGNTALLMASLLQENYIAKKLLSSGANPLICSNQGRTSLYVAAERGNCTLLSLFIQEFNIHPDTPSTSEGHGGGALHVAAMFNRPNAVHHLLQLGANPNIKDRNGRSALEVAKQSAAQLAVEVIENHVINVNVTR